MRFALGDMSFAAEVQKVTAHHPEAAAVHCGCGLRLVAGFSWFLQRKLAVAKLALLQAQHVHRLGREPVQQQL